MSIVTQCSIARSGFIAFSCQDDDRGYRSVLVFSTSASNTLRASTQCVEYFSHAPSYMPRRIIWPSAVCQECMSRCTRASLSLSFNVLLECIFSSYLSVFPPANNIFFIISLFILLIFYLLSMSFAFLHVLNIIFIRWHRLPRT